jgi:putative proteasome-type protease
MRAYHPLFRRPTDDDDYSMTYCVSMLLDGGLVFLSDSRTNAGVDQINTFRKTTVYERKGERVLVLLSAGNLAITQGVISLLAERITSQHGEMNLHNCANLFEAARCVGAALREMHHRDAEALRVQGVEFNASFILGGQIKGESPRLFHLYPAGNFVEATPDTSYFQIGESKYGKPIIDRVIRRSMPLSEAAKCALISMDSTIRSNLSVGLPLDLVIVRRDEYRVSSHVDIDATNPYFQRIRERWGEALREIFSELPNPDWLLNTSPPDTGRSAPPAATAPPARLQTTRTK